ncbi:hypothetical protein CDAR_301781 [Caerostris darwini]|uniref:Uncharacterized protein n=1 Tax=Caerostris darwini TaxID=1538125 RepID=A0AAV4VEA7_9ARAC|nr:hypothetical protein CDAR_301781 [Caerostris darwini]
MNEKEGEGGRKRTIPQVRTLKGHFLSFGVPFLLHHRPAGSDERRIQSVSSRGSGKCRLRRLLETMDIPHCFLDVAFFLALSSGHGLDVSSKQNLIKLTSLFQQ